MADEITLAAERIVCGSGMAYTDAIEITAARLAGRDFLDTRHETVFTHLVAAWSEGVPTDPVALARRLTDTAEIGRAGGLPYLHTLYAQALPPANVAHHAGIVADASQRRRLARAGLVIAQAAEVDDTARRGQLVADALATIADSTADQTGHSWTPVDLDPYVRGTIERPAPSLGIVRRDGLRLIYPGRDHVVIGEMESAKTWLAAACVAAELEADRHTVYVHFEEPEPSDLVDRLLALGVAPAAIVKRLRFVAPDRPVTPAALTRLLDPPPSLVCFDGVNEGMSLHGWAIREEDGAARFRRHLVMPCLHVGAATLGCDHVIKDIERRGRYAIGSIHKGNAITGALILLENVEPFGRGRRGASHVFVTKDRPGHLRQHGQPGKVAGKTYMGTLIVDDEQHSTPDLELVFLPPADKPTAATDPDAETDAVVLGAVIHVISTGNMPSLRAVRAATGLSHDTTDQALARLTLAGRLTETIGKRGARVFTVPEDHSPESAQ